MMNQQMLRACAAYHGLQVPVVFSIRTEAVIPTLRLIQELASKEQHCNCTVSMGGGRKG